VLVFGVALGVGVVAYAVSRRLSQEPLEAADTPPPVARATRSPLARFRRRSAPAEETLGFGPEPAPPEGGSERFGALIYVPVLHVADPEWRTRVGAALGLILLVTAAALILALAIYQLGRATDAMIQGFMGY
jgi:hypothetical protein